MELTIGADPEFFVQHRGKFVTAYGLIPGTKENPHKVDNGAIQVDGMALEINIDPAKTPKEFTNNINSVLATLSGMIDPELDMILESSTANFDIKYMKQMPEEAIRLGCDPDYSAYTKSLRPDFKHPEFERYAGGHIHLGWTKDQVPEDPSHIDACCDIAIQLDYYLGVPSTYYDRGNKRSQYYGLAGTFRPKPYGLEYRTLSNFWLKNNKSMENVFHWTKKAFENFMKGEIREEEMKKQGRTEHWAKRVINEQAIYDAGDYCQTYGVRM